MDAAGLRERLAKHAGVELGKDDETALKRSWNGLYRHHGELTLHRIEELAGLTEQALGKVPEDTKAGIRGQLQKQLAGYHRMIDMAEAKGVSGQIAGVAPTAAPAPASKTKAGKPSTPDSGKVYHIPSHQLQVDPARFQYKLNVDKSGVTDELKSVKTFNPDFAGVISVWADPADGKVYVVNGHHRYELAHRTGHAALAVRYGDAKTAKEARAVGALNNIAEGRGTAVDAAKVHA